MVRQGHPNGLPAHLPYDPPLHHLGGHQADGPPRVPVGRRPADQRHDRGLLDAVQLACTARPGVIAERGLQPVRQKPRQHPSDLAVVPADGGGSGAYGQAGVQVLKRQDPTPGPGRQLLPARLHPLQLPVVARGQLQPGDSLRVAGHLNA